MRSTLILLPEPGLAEMGAEEHNNASESLHMSVFNYFLPEYIKCPTHPHTDHRPLCTVLYSLDTIKPFIRRRQCLYLYARFKNL